MKYHTPRQLHGRSDDSQSRSRVSALAGPLSALTWLELAAEEPTELGLKDAREAGRGLGAIATALNMAPAAGRRADTPPPLASSAARRRACDLGPGG
jgi:hypothetical protein